VPAAGTTQIATADVLATDALLVTVAGGVVQAALAAVDVACSATRLAACVGVAQVAVLTVLATVADVVAV